MNHFIEHFRLDVEILGDRTRETWYHSDPENGIRRQRVIEEWAGRKRIGVGAGGEVFREYSDRGGVRAIKAIRKPENSDLSGFIKELVAMGHLSKVFRPSLIHLSCLATDVDLMMCILNRTMTSSWNYTDGISVINFYTWPWNTSSWVILQCAMKIACQNRTFES